MLTSFKIRVPWNLSKLQNFDEISWNFDVFWYPRKLSNFVKFRQISSKFCQISSNFVKFWSNFVKFCQNFVKFRQISSNFVKSQEIDGFDGTCPGFWRVFWWNFWFFVKIFKERIQKFSNLGFSKVSKSEVSQNFVVTKNSEKSRNLTILHSRACVGRANFDFLTEFEDCQNFGRLTSRGFFQNFGYRDCQYFFLILG